MPYVSAFVAAVPVANKHAYLQTAHKSWPLFKEYGALSMQENWEADVPEGKLTSFPMAVKREDGEAVVLSWIIWPDAATADACMAAMETDARWSEVMDMPFDGKRMIFGSFEPIFES